MICFKAEYNIVTSEPLKLYINTVLARTGLSLSHCCVVFICYTLCYINIAFNFILKIFTFRFLLIKELGSLSECRAELGYFPIFIRLVSDWPFYEKRAARKLFGLLCAIACSDQASNLQIVCFMWNWPIRHIFFSQKTDAKIGCSSFSIFITFVAQLA